MYKMVVEIDRKSYTMQHCKGIKYIIQHLDGVDFEELLPYQFAVSATESAREAIIALANADCLYIKESR